MLEIPDPQISVHLLRLPASSDSIGDSTADDSAVNEDACCVAGGMPATQQVGGNVLAVVDDVTAVC